MTLLQRVRGSFFATTTTLIAKTNHTLLVKPITTPRAWHSTKNNPLQIGAQPCNPRLENNKENSITECKEWGLEKKVDPTGVLMEQIVIKESNKRGFFTPCGNFLSLISIAEPHYIFSMILKLNRNKIGFWARDS